MFEGKTNHICSITEESSNSFLPVIPPTANKWTKCKRFVKKLILVTEINPLSLMFYKKSSRIAEARQAQVDSGSWIIHPFSTLRLYYEMWMTFMFLIFMIYFPFHSSYIYVIRKHSHIGIDNCLVFFCYVDIFLTFRTGFVVSKEVILMKPWQIAKKYVFESYFIVDVLSSLPTFVESIEYSIFMDVYNACGILKIFRMKTFLKYLERTLNYFRLDGFKALLIKMIIVSIIICHICSCMHFFVVLLVYAIREDRTLTEVSYLLIKDSGNDFDNVLWYYVERFYKCASYLLTIQTNFDWSRTWVHYIIVIILLISGKILLTFLTVILIDIFKNFKFLENKYNSMMNQVDSFMTVHQFPIGLQKKIRSFYSYKYRNKYLNETRIEKFLSEKLRKEVRYHECRKLVQDVKLFEMFPQNILEDILTALKMELYMPNDTIIKAGISGDSMYFLSCGTVAVISPAGKEICHLMDGDYFGELCLLVPKAKRSASIIAIEICETYKMNKKVFKKYIEQYPALLKDIQKEAKRRRNETKNIDSVFIDLARHVK